MQRKPKELHVGRAYRMWAPFCAGPSDLIAIVVKIKYVTKTTRAVYVEWTRDGSDWSADPGWRVDGYDNFLRRVHSEAPNMVH